ncbi:hypothetical protein [Mesorhizobium australicum]|uniref:Uncharacterized protein n=1 Tax=Mesorhizobium australicum TaxID=536018 RepID=A0A1X7NVL3_9HYPH|nr:hypothetical protein [Mesorhizobium australicum]SMH42269.1 hypothetical protein SAMN02982922_2730 [Mesorhizobium australicum]
MIVATLLSWLVAILAIVAGIFVVIAGGIWHEFAPVEDSRPTIALWGGVGLFGLGVLLFGANVWELFQ